MKKSLAAICVFCLLLCSGTANAQVDLGGTSMTGVFETPGVHLELDPSSIVVIEEPTIGELFVDGDIVYFPGDSTEIDSFMLVAQLVTGEVVDIFGEGSPVGVSLSFAYARTTNTGKPGKPKSVPGGTVTNNGDGTVTVSGGGTTVTGTVFQGPNTSIDFPDGSVVIGTDNSVPSDTTIIDSNDGSTIDVHDEVGGRVGIKQILESHPDGSITSLGVVGHGSTSGGVTSSTGGGFTGPGLTNDPDLVDLIKKKLKPNAPIVIMGCDQFEPGHAGGCQDISDLTDRPVIINEDPISFDPRDPDDEDGWWHGQGNWYQLDPTKDEGEGDDGPTN